MRPIALLLLAVGLLNVACEAESVPTTSPPAPTTSSTTTTVPEQTYSFSYQLEPGEALVYQIDFTRRLRIGSAGATQGPLRDLPASADLTIRRTGEYVFDVEPGPEPDTFRLVRRGQPGRLEVEGTIDGEEVEDVEALQGLSGAERIPAEMVIDTTGLIRARATGLELLPPLISSPGFLGPVWPDGEVSSEWTFSHPHRSLGSLESESTVSARVVGDEAVDDTPTVVVEGQSNAGEEQVDLTDFYRQFLASFGSEVEGASLAVATAPEEHLWTAWFDPEKGRLVRSETRSRRQSRLEGTTAASAQEQVEFDLTLEVEDDVTARLRPSPQG